MSKSLRRYDLADRNNNKKHKIDINENLKTKMENDIIAWLKKHNYEYIPILELQDMIDVWTLLCNGIFVNNVTNNIVMLYYGIYCYMKNDTHGMFAYFMAGIDNGCNYAMLNLGYYYFYKCDYVNMEKYYNMAIYHGNKHAYYNYGRYYKIIGDKDNMIRFYLLGIEAGDNYAMSALGKYYYEKRMHELIMQELKI